MSNQQSVNIPQWEVNDLNALSAQGDLSGVPPYVLAGMAENESGGEVNGAAINSSGYGGYFGDWDQTIDPSILTTSSQASFDEQAQMVAQQLVNQSSSYGILGDVAIYNLGARGSNNGANWQASPDAVDANALAPGTNLKGSAPVGASLGGAAAPTGSSGSGGSSGSSGSSGGGGGSTSINLTSPLGTSTPQLGLNPITDIKNIIGSGAQNTANSVLGAILPWLVMGLGCIFVIAGFFLTFRSGTKVNLTMPKTNQPKQPAPQPAPQPKPHPVEHAAEDAAVAGAAA